MELVVCPHCNFSKQVSPDKIPQKTKVKCPKCQNFFQFVKSGRPAPSSASEAPIEMARPTAPPPAQVTNTTTYEPPVQDAQADGPVEIPLEIEKKIKAGWIAAIVSGTLTALFILIAVTTGFMGGLFDWWTLIDVVLIYALAFGIYKKSRFASTFMFVYFLASKIWMIAATGKPTGIVMAVIFLYYYFQAMMGTYQYHKLMKDSF